MRHHSAGRDADVVVIGAGPYGLSVASHLRDQGVNLRVFGAPMATWANEMPETMLLKSEGFASNIADPRGEFTLGAYCRQTGADYADIGLPIPLGTFVAYGRAFQERFVPHLEETEVTGVEPLSSGFRVTLADGESFSARRVIVAIGISAFDYSPPVLDTLPSMLRSHSSHCKAVAAFAGREIAVIGAGASALNVAADLVGTGASVHVIARKPKIDFGERSEPSRPLIEHIRAPLSGVGHGWRSRFCADAPLVFHAFPERLRHRIVKGHLGPAPGWFVKDRVAGRINPVLGHSVKAATAQDGRVALHLLGQDGAERTLTVDHVIAGTGYKVDMRRIAFFGAAMRAQLSTADHTPVLSRHFESSIPGLYFVGTTAANSFGPMLRFVFGANFAAKRLTRHLTRVRSPLALNAKARHHWRIDEIRGEQVSDD